MLTYNEPYISAEYFAITYYLWAYILMYVWVMGGWILDFLYDFASAK